MRYLKKILKDILKNHIITHSSEKLHKCNICQKLYAHKGKLNIRRKKNVLKMHMFTHTKESPHKFNICQKSYTYKFELNNH